MTEVSRIRLIPNAAAARPELFQDKGGPLPEWAENAGVSQNIIDLSTEPIKLLDGLWRTFADRDKWEEVAFDNQLEHTIPRPKPANLNPQPKLVRLLSPEFQVPYLDEQPGQASQLMAVWIKRTSNSPYVSHYKSALAEPLAYIGQEVRWGLGLPASLSMGLRLPEPPGIREITTRKTDETYRLNAIKTIMYACQLLVPARRTVKRV